MRLLYSAFSLTGKISCQKHWLVCSFIAETVDLEISLHRSNYAGRLSKARYTRRENDLILSRSCTHRYISSFFLLHSNRPIEYIVLNCCNFDLTKHFLMGRDLSQKLDLRTPAKNHFSVNYKANFKFHDIIFSKSTK